LTLKVVSESRVTWATSVPILVFLGLSVLELGPMYATDVRQKHRLMHQPYGSGCIITSSLSFVVWKPTHCSVGLLSCWLICTQPPIIYP